MQILEKNADIICWTSWQENQCSLATYSICGKRGRTCPNKSIEWCKSYSYLGVELCNTGSYKATQQIQYKKAMHDLFKLKCMIGLNVRLNNEALRPTGKPIDLYGSDIWGTDLLNSNSNDTILRKLTVLMCEKLNISACMYAFAVHKKSQTSAVRGQFGRYPSGLDVLRNIVSYRDYLQKKSAGTLWPRRKYLTKLSPRTTRATK